jgi:radical SAM/Cys-rich protein
MTPVLLSPRAPNPGHLGHRFDSKLTEIHRSLQRKTTEILQLNLGKLCNLTCSHCHVNAGPKRREIMTRQTMDRILGWLEPTSIPTVDLTGGAPEMNPDFRYLVEKLRSQPQPRHLIDRCNLTILLEPDYRDLATFLARNEVEIIASMPCYEPKNVNEQRGDGVFDASIEGLQQLNALGYGTDPKLPLNLVYNPNGPFLPGPQAELEADYREALGKNFGIVFNHLFTITNMPISRFASQLRHAGKLETYMEVLVQAFNPLTLESVMCRNTLSVGWQGDVYDCDFNQMLEIPWAGRSLQYLWDVPLNALEGSPIVTGDHCFGCTAGCGSSCGGALTA